MRNTKIYLDLRPNSAKRGLVSTVSTVFNANILVLLTTILDVPFFNLFAAEIRFLHFQLLVTVFDCQNT